MPYIVEGENSL